MTTKPLTRRPRLADPNAVKLWCVTAYDETGKQVSTAYRHRDVNDLVRRLQLRYHRVEVTSWIATLDPHA